MTRIQIANHNSQGTKLQNPDPKAQSNRRVWSLEFGIWNFLGVCCFVLGAFSPLAYGQATSKLQQHALGAVTDTPAITIGGATADSAATPTTGAHEAHIQWKFGTVTGTYTTCTVQAKTSYDGTSFLTLGSAASVAVTSSTVNAWTLLEQAGTTSVTTSSVSSSAALGFGLLTKFTFACSGAYGTTAPVTVSVIYR